MKVDYINAFKVEQILARRLIRMERVGWPVDTDRIDEIEEELTDNMEALEDHIIPSVPMTPKDAFKPVLKPFKKDGAVTKSVSDFMEDHAQHVEGPFCKIRWEVINLGSDKQVKTYLRSIGWIPVEWNINRETGQVTSPKLTEDSYDSLKTDIGRQIALYLKLKHRRSLVQGLRKIVWVDKEGENRISQRVSGMTPTFRCTHKGIVNIPGGDAIFGLAIRSIFKAPKGYKMLGVDAKSCQLRMLCHYMRDPIYTEAVMNGSSKDGTDIHSVNMKLTEGLLTLRTQAKRFIYGLLFGAGNPKLGAILGGTKADGLRLREVFMDKLPTLKQLLDALERTWKAKGYLVGLDGRKVYVRKKHQLLVYLVQSAEGILMRWALALLDNWGFFDKFDVELVGFIHDEYQFYVREDQAELAAEWVLSAISHASHYLKLTVPAEGDPAVGDTWMDTH